jgi:hypothetical protein
VERLVFNALAAEKRLLTGRPPSNHGRLGTGRSPITDLITPEAEPTGAALASVAVAVLESVFHQDVPGLPVLPLNIKLHRVVVSNP